MLFLKVPALLYLTKFYLINLWKEKKHRKRGWVAS